MARPWRVRFAGAKYHLTGRENGRAALFLAPEDYARFMEQLDAALDEGYGSEAAVGKARKRAQAVLAHAPAFGVAERKLIRRLSASKGGCQLCLKATF